MQSKLAALTRATLLVGAVALLPMTTAGLAAVDARSAPQIGRLLTVWQLIKANYVESVDDGRAFYERLRVLAERKPIVLFKGGATAGGQRAAASHTGALASDDTVFDGMARQAGVTRAANVEQAFELAATFASQPLPTGDLRWQKPLPLRAPPWKRRWPASGEISSG